MNRIERFKYVVSQLKKSGYIKNQKDLGAMMGYSNESAFSQVLTGKVAEPKEFTLKLKSLFPELNVEWINTGQGSVFNTSSVNEGSHTSLFASHNSVEITSNSSFDGTRQVRYFPNLEATGGNMQLFEDYLEESVSLSIPRHFDADFALPLAGDSMVPLYHPGCIILVKRWLERFIEYGKVYLIVTKQGNRMVKYLRPAEREDEVLCTSENSAYEPFTIPREDILALYMVKGCIFQHSM